MLTSGCLLLESTEKKMLGDIKELFGEVYQR